MSSQTPVYRFTLGDDQFAIFCVAHGAGRPDPALTAAEHAVVNLVRRGLSDREIARLRGTSERTVANQLRSAFRRLNVTTRAELIAK